MIFNMFSRLHRYRARDIIHLFLSYSVHTDIDTVFNNLKFRISDEFPRSLKDKIRVIFRQKMFFTTIATRKYHRNFSSDEIIKILYLKDTVLLRITK